jgi:hypothetical protein
MGFKLVNSFTSEIEKLKVKDIYAALDGDDAADMPFWIWFLENPESPVPMPGKISLYNHDHLHILLGRDRSPEDEAFIIGFTMGNDPQTAWYHILIFKIFSFFIYPKLYKFNRQQMRVFDLGFAYGRKLSFKEIHQINFAAYQNYTLSALRKLLGIEPDEIRAIKQVEQWLVHSTTPVDGSISSSQSGTILMQPSN